MPCELLVMGRDKLHKNQPPRIVDPKDSRYDEWKAWEYKDQAGSWKRGYVVNVSEWGTFRESPAPRSIMVFVRVTNLSVGDALVLTAPDISILVDMNEDPIFHWRRRHRIEFALLPDDKRDELIAPRGSRDITLTLAELRTALIDQRVN